MTTEQQEKGEVKEVAGETPTKSLEVSPPVPPKTYPEDEVKRLLSEQYNKLNETLSKQGAELARLRKAQANPQQARPANTIIQGLLREIEELPDDGSLDLSARKQRIAVLKQQIQREEEAARYEDMATAKRAGMHQRIIEAGRDPTDELFEDVIDAF